MLLAGSAKITSSGLMCRSAMTLHKEAGERGQTGWIVALRRKPAEHAFVLAMRLSHGCPSKKVRKRSRVQCYCCVNGSLHVTWVALVVIVRVLRAYG